MFKLMIADDNPYVLQELCNMTDWENYDLSITGCYTTGKALLDDASLDMPDVVITDIAMPGMDGISLASELRSLSPSVKIIFISSFAEFEFAQKALSLHISGYVLKPFHPKQLTDVMNKVLQELRAETLRRFEQHHSQLQVEQFRRFALENYLSGLLYHALEDTLVQTQFDKLQVPLPTSYVLQVVCATFSGDVKTRSSYRESLNKVRSILQSYEQPNLQLVLLPIDWNQFAFLIISASDHYDVPNLLAKLNIDIEMMAGLRTSMGYSTTTDSFLSIPILFEQAHTAATQSATVNPVLTSYEEIQTEQSEPVDVDSEFIPPESVSSYVQKMREYIEAHYAESITTSNVAAAVFLSPNYANQRFSAEFGCSIFDYVTQCRIKESKRLLKETNEKVTSIAEMVGYGSRINFYLAFKRNVGISPTEYKALKKQKPV